MLQVEDPVLHACFMYLIAPVFFDCWLYFQGNQLLTGKCIVTGSNTPFHLFPSSWHAGSYHYTRRCIRACDVTPA